MWNFLSFRLPFFLLPTYVKMQYLLLFFIGGRKSNSPFQIILVKITAQKLKLKLEALFRFIPKFLECKPIKSESRAMFQKSSRLLRIIDQENAMYIKKEDRVTSCRNSESNVNDWFEKIVLCEVHDNCKSKKFFNSMLDVFNEFSERTIVTHTHFVWFWHPNNSDFSSNMHHNTY